MGPVGLIRNFVAVTSTMLLAGCLSVFKPVTVVYEAPSSIEGKRCIAQCTYAKNNCFRQCGTQAHDCRIKEMQFDALNNAIRTLEKFARSTAKEPVKVQETVSACQQTRDGCATKCEGDMFCATQCEIDYKFCAALGDVRAGSSMDMESAFKGFDARRCTENICDKRWCDDLCRDDYRACFIGCGGRTYIEPSDSKPKN